MAQARSNIPTVAERLKDRTLDTPSIASRYLSEYDEKRPNFVNPDRNAGAGMAALARSLQGFNKEFDKAATTKLDKMVEEEVAHGDYILKSQYDSEDALRNRKEWKQLIKEKPELAGLSPWVAVGYERSRMRELGMEMKSGLNKFIDEQGLLNAEDPKALQSGVNTYIKHFREEVGIDSYNDKLLIAEHFSPLEAEARKAVTSTYDRVQMAQRESKMVTQYSSEMATMIAAAEEAGTPIDMEGLQAIGKEAVENGMDASNLPALFLSAYKTAYAKSKNRKTLNSIENLVIGRDSKGKPITLKDTDEGARWWRTETDKNIAEDKRKEHEAIIDGKLRREELENKVVSECLFGENGKVLSHDEALAKYTELLGHEPTADEKMSFYKAYNTGVGVFNRSIEIRNSTTDSYIANQEAINNLLLTTTGDTLKQEATKLLVSSGKHPLVQQFWHDVMTGGDATTKALQESAKVVDKNLKDMADNYIDTLVGDHFKGDSTQPKNELYIDNAKTYLKNAITRDYNIALVNAMEAKLATLTDGRTSLNKAEIEECRKTAMESVKDTSVWSERYKGAINPNMFAYTPTGNTYSWMNTVSPELLPEYRIKAQAMDEFLKSSDNPTTFKSIDEMSKFIDVPAMLDAGITSITPQNVLSFSKPEFGLQTAMFSPDGRTVIVPPEVFKSRANADAQVQSLKTVFPSLRYTLLSPSPVTREEMIQCNNRIYQTKEDFSSKRPAVGLEAPIEEQQARMFLYVLEATNGEPPVDLSSVESITGVSKAELYDKLSGFNTAEKNILFYRAGLLTESEVTRKETPPKKKTRRVDDSFGRMTGYQRRKPKPTGEFDPSKLPDEVFEVDGIE